MGGRLPHSPVIMRPRSAQETYARFNSERLVVAAQNTRPPASASTRKSSKRLTVLRARRKCRIISNLYIAIKTTALQIASSGLNSVPSSSVINFIAVYTRFYPCPYRSVQWKRGENGSENALNIATCFWNLTTLFAHLTAFADVRRRV